VILDLPAREVGEWWEENAWQRDDADVCARVLAGAPTLRSLGSFGRPATPTAYLLDRDGRVLRSEVGAMTSVPDWLQPDTARMVGTR
jgi:hypothetical protein